MPESEDIYATLNAAQERFAYFFLAAAGASIAFALVRLEGQGIAYWMIPAGLAVASWGISFYSGAQYLNHRSSILLLNFQRQRITSGKDAWIVGKTQSQLLDALGQLDNAAKAKREKLLPAGDLQFRLFFAGAVLYVVALVCRALATC